jgi:hypothetical protein
LERRAEVPRRFAGSGLALLVLLGATGFADVPAPDYQELRLESVYPAGGQAGQSVVVEFRSTRTDLLEARQILVDGPPGITVRELKQEPKRLVAILDLAADAVPGRRGLRVLGERVGLTNMIYFTVGRLPEHLEQEPNGELQPQSISVPSVVNARIDPEADVDCFVFSARAGQPIVALAAAHAFDSHGQAKNYGIVDLDLQIVNDRGQVLAEAQDTWGLDPLVEFVAPADGQYTARVQHVLYRGYPQAIYRLIIGEVPVPTAVFPPGIERGKTVNLRLFGPNVPDGAERQVSAPLGDDFPFGFVDHEATAGDVQMPIVRGDLPEILEAEPNDQSSQGTLLAMGTTANGRFERAGDVDWYRIPLQEKQSVHLQTLAHRFLRSPADTSLELWDAAGKKLAENDDGFPIDYMSYHDFQPTDSQLTFQAPAAGDYFVKVTEQSGASGPRAVYRLTAKAAEPDFEMQLYPDGVPIWGPGSTASVLVKVDRLHGLNDDIHLRIEGLPAGWTSSTAVNIAQTPERPSSSFYNHFGLRTFLTITAPPTAQVGDLVSFRIVGRTTRDGRTFERIARPLTWYYTSDIGFFRMTPLARAAVARPQGPWLSTTVSELSAAPGEKVQVPVQVHGAGEAATLGLVVNMATAGVACAYNPPAPVAIQNGTAVVTLTVTPETPPGEFYFTVARTWGSDIRVGMPGPCTPLIKLNIRAK